MRESREAHELLSNAHKEKHDILTEAHKEGQNIITSSTQKGEILAKNLLEEAQTNARKQMEMLDAKEKMLTESVERDFVARAPELVAALYEKTLRTTMTAQGNDELVSRIARG